MMKTKICSVLLAACICALCGAADLNVTPSPDGTLEAFTRDGNLWIREMATGIETRLTSDASPTISNGYASWLYYEEILGRASKYKAFWWSPDSQRLAFYRFDEGRVPVFPIYSAEGQCGSLNLTRYPKAGQANPEVRIGIFDLCPIVGNKPILTWTDFELGEQYFGTPFWSADGRSFFVQRQPRRQNQLGLYRIDAQTGRKTLIYSENSDTWTEFISGMKFGRKGLYMARSFETPWEQIYYLSYDGKTLRKLTSGENWDVSLVNVDEEKGDVWFMARRDNPLHPTLYRVDFKGSITTITNPDFWAKNAKVSETGISYTVELSTARSPWRTVAVDAYYGYKSWELPVASVNDEVPDPERPMPEVVTIENDGFRLYGLVSHPKGFDPSKKYPVLMTVYGGPGTAYVRDRWKDRDASSRWCWEHGIIYMVVDPRSSGENGRRGLDQAFRRMTVPELGDYIAWARHMQAKSYVKADRIGVTGFSFGGTTTAMLVLRYPEYFHCGVAGGGVYDWTLYDSAYTERFMEMPEQNPKGYTEARVLDYVKPGVKANLRLTHGTGDDNVHFQNTLQLAKAMQEAGVQFELMIYPDGMHGYRGAQKDFDIEQESDFWQRMLLD